MDINIKELNNMLSGKVDFFSYKIKDSVSFVTGNCRSAMIDEDGIDIRDMVVVVFFKNNNDMFEFAFDDFEITKSQYIKFYKDNAVLTLKIR